MVASLGVEPRWASPVDFESTASTNSATRPGASRYDTSIVYEILFRLRPTGGTAHTTGRDSAARGVHGLRRDSLRESARRGRLRARMAGPYSALPAGHHATARVLDRTG